MSNKHLNLYYYPRISVQSLFLDKVFQQGDPKEFFISLNELAYCIDKWGINKSIELIEGMFAIGIWDKQAKCLSLARDFAGIKPLFYGWNKNGFVFSRESKTSSW